jgi:hypothetical protein
MITDEDIKYMDADVCILFPDSQKGVIVWTSQTTIEGIDILRDGIKSGWLLNKEGIRYGRITNHPYIFFRAPDKKYTDIGECPKYDNRFYIRVDPDRTFVFSSELRRKYTPQCKYGTLEYISKINENLVKSRKTLTQFLDIIEENDNNKDIDNGQRFVYNLLTSRKIIQTTYHPIKYPYDYIDVKKSSEILVHIPHLTPDFLIL